MSKKRKDYPPDKLLKISVVFFLLLIAMTGGCLQQENTITGSMNSPITKEDAVKIVLNDSAVIKWIDHDTYKVQDVHLEITNISRKDRVEVQKFWIVHLYMEKNGSVCHWNLVVTMNGTVEYNRYPRCIPLSDEIFSNFTGITPKTISADDAVRIALNNTQVKNEIKTSPYEVHTPSREMVQEGDGPQQEVWKVQIWMPDRLLIIIVEVANDGSIWGIRHGHNPYVMEASMSNSSRNSS